MTADPKMYGYRNTNVGMCVHTMISIEKRIRVSVKHCNATAMNTMAEQSKHPFLKNITQDRNWYERYPRDKDGRNAGRRIVRQNRTERSSPMPDFIPKLIYPDIYWFIISIRSTYLYSITFRVVSLRTIR